MKNIFWIVDKEIAGRPGPDKFPWKIDDIKDSGFSSIISVNNGKDCDVEEITLSGLTYSCVPLSNNAPPVQGDIDLCLKRLPIAYNFIKRNVKNGAVMVHCMSGKDRTGLLLAYYLMKENNIAPEEAMAAIIGKREIAFSANGWMEFCLEVLKQSKTRG